MSIPPCPSHHDDSYPSGGFYPFKQDLKLTEVLNQQKFTISAEVIPPRNGAEQFQVFQQIGKLVEAGAQFLSVTKGAGGSLRGGSLPIAQAIKEQLSLPCIAHFTCRDLTPHEVENHLMDHHYFGIRNILALRGDPPNGQPNWAPRDGGYHYAYQLIEQIRKLNHGSYLERPNGPGARSDTQESQIKTDFCIGAAAYPDFPDEHQRIEFFQMKVQAGAEFGITDMVFDPDSYGRFLDQCRKRGILVPILPGTRFLKNQPQARRMAEKFKVKIPDWVLNALPAAPSSSTVAVSAAESQSHTLSQALFDDALEVFLKIAARLKSLGAPGLHLYVISDTEGACAALRRLAFH